MNPVSKDRPLNPYEWGAGCDGWNLVDTKGMSVKMERMPPHTSEKRHRHREARQFFFILQGNALFETDEGVFGVAEREGIEIRPGVAHRILNEGGIDLEFILCSQPSTAGDREEV